MSVQNKQPNGQTGKHAGAKADAEALRLRVVLELMGEGRPRGEIKKIVSSQLGIRPRSVERYMRLAQAHLRAEIGKAVIDLRSESYAFYMSVQRNAGATVSEKLKARQSIDRLLGVAVAQKHEVTIPAPQDIPIDGSENKVPDASQAVQQIRLIYGLRSSAGPAARDKEPA